MKTDLFDYSLPERLIAQQPVDRRDDSRLLVVHRQQHTIEHRHFRDLPAYLSAGDCLFRNNAAVIPARLHATRPTGGQVECLLLRPAIAPQSQASDQWWCLLRPGKKLPLGATFSREGFFTGTVLEKTADGLVRVAFTTSGHDILAIANQIGEMPLPPYITGRDNDAARSIDRERYQTVYADRGHQVAAAAPTAGLHFTPQLLSQLATQGISTADVTLHVGLGTFRPITTDSIEDHAIHREIYEMPKITAQALRATQGRRIAVGTTSVRAFRGVDALITNFHQPRSTLLCLVAAFLAPESTEGIAWLKEIYAEAIAQEYRFFSYGDAMLIL